MRTVTVIAFVAFVASGVVPVPARAQDLRVSAAQIFAGDPNAYALYREGRAQRITGILLSSIGMLFGTIAVLVVPSAALAEDQWNREIGLLMGGTCAVMAAGHLVPGLLLWIAGQRRVEEAYRLVGR